MAYALSSLLESPKNLSKKEFSSSTTTGTATH